MCSRPRERPTPRSLASTIRLPSGPVCFTAWPKCRGQVRAALQAATVRALPTLRRVCWLHTRFAPKATKRQMHSWWYEATRGAVADPCSPSTPCSNFATRPIARCRPPHEASDNSNSPTLSTAQHRPPNHARAGQLSAGVCHWRGSAWPPGCSINSACGGQLPSAAPHLA